MNTEYQVKSKLTWAVCKKSVKWKKKKKSGEGAMTTSKSEYFPGL